MKSALFFVLFVLLLCVFAPVLFAADSVAPASVTITNIREEAEAYVSGVYYFEGTTLRFTNCVAYAGTSTNSAKQGLDGVTIDVAIGTTSTNVHYSGTVGVATSGLWWCSVSVPSNLPTTYVQLKLTDGSGNSYIYPWKYMRTKAGL